MADHKAEQIMQTVMAVVTGLATTGANVQRGRVYQVPADITRALSVYQGPDVPIIDDKLWNPVDSELTVYIEILAKDNTEQIDTALNQIRKELTIALFANYTLGLGFVINLVEGIAPEPELDGEGGTITAAMRTEWIITYRRSALDPSL